jgi:hypothetical protein
MNQLEGFLILTTLPLSLVLTGYWLASLLADSEPAERLAFALAAGLGLLLAAVAFVNFFHPLRGAWAYACLAPILLTVLLPRSRASLAADLAAVLRPFPRAVVGAGIVFFVLLLWPVIQAPASLFYDGTSNHDSFFWIAGTEHLKRHSYMEQPVMSATQPLTNTTSALIGWNPPWGRIGGEALLALASSVVNLSPIKLYLYATASMAVVWFGLAWLALRTFVTSTPARLTAVAVVGLQPVFVFFHSNANLPNLLGTLTGTALIIAVERLVRAAGGPRAAFVAWAALAALSLHGLLCSYPEMVPFALLPCALLWLRPWFTAGPRAYARTALVVALVLLAGAALNPATTIRAVNGFVASFKMARADATWANLFDPLEAAEYIPGFFTLCVTGCKRLGWWFGWPLTGLILGLIVLVVRRSRDPFGFCAGLAGGAALLGYTLATGFVYGWQKSAQFSAIFVVLLFPVGAVDLLARARAAAAGTRRTAATAALAVIALFMGYICLMNWLDVSKWSDRKVISDDWFALRDQSRSVYKEAPILVEASSFRMAFFHSMWSTYFLPESRLYFAARGDESGGYLRSWVVNEQKAAIPAPAAVLVGRAWADSFDANSPRLLTGREFALLGRNNRVLNLEGWFPLNGLPMYATGEITIELVPHRDSRLTLELLPRKPELWPGAAWEVARTAPDTPDFTAPVTGAAPWVMQVPLAGGRRNRVTLRLTGDSVAHARQVIAAETAAGETDGPLVFIVRTVRVEDAP